MSVNSVNSADHRGRNAAIGAGVGLVGGGAAGYFTKSILNDGNFSDEFVHKVAVANAADDNAKNALNLTKKIAEMGDEKKKKKIKKVLTKVSEISADSLGTDKEAAKKVITEGSDDEIKTLFQTVKSAIDTTYEAVKNSISESLENVYDKAGKKFKELPADAAEETKKLFEAAKKTARNIKLKPAAIYGAAGAVVAGLAGFLATPKAKPAEEKAKA